MHFLQITDLHIKRPGRLAYRRVDSAAYLARCVAHILAQPDRPEAIVLTGDLVDAGAPEEYAHLRTVLAPLDAAGIRMLPVLGNHDGRDAAREAFADWLAPIPAAAQDPHAFQYWTDIGDVRLIVLDTLDTGHPGGRLGVARLDWLEDALAAETGRPVVIAMHHPPFATGIGHMDVQSLAEDDIPPLAQIVRAAEKTSHWLPALADAGAAHFWSGARTFAADGRFVLGADPRMQGLFWAAGLGGHGITCAPAVGRILADCLANGRAARPEEAALGPERLLAAPQPRT